MRRHSGCLLELLDEIAGVVETYFQCDLCDRGVGMQKQRLGFLDAQKEEVAKSAMEALLSLIRHDGVDKKISFTARLVIRESTGKKCYCKQ